MDKRTKTKLGAALAALALVIAGGGYYFFHADDDTPAYTMKMIQRSVEKHDTKTFYRMVDVDGVLDSGYDGFVEGLSSSVDASTPDAKEAVREFAQILRGSLILTLKTAIDSYVSTGDLNVDDGLIELLDRTGLNDAQVRDIKYSSQRRGQKRGLRRPDNFSTRFEQRISPPFDFDAQR